MCGIVALYSTLSNEERQSTLSLMTRAIKHRGPDHQGEWWDDKLSFGLAQRRLAIVDLSPDGQQPMISISKRYVVSFNGEIYNFGTLRDDLMALGHKFRGRSDTEVLLAAIEAWGLNTTCQKINGMFAILLWDRERQELHLIRDRLGKKPLYFGWAGSDFICASELRAFMAHPRFKRSVSGAALSHYLHLGFIPAPYAIFSDVSMLLPGHRMILKLSELKSGADLRGLMESYWSPARMVEDAHTRRATMARMEAGERLRLTESVIEQAVTSRMVADVPLGAFLSGGIDSSLVVSLMQRNANRPVKTYAIGFSEAGYNEAPHARAVAEHLGTDHHEQILTTDDALSIVTDLPDLCDEPMGDVSFIPTYMVARFARTDVTVALSGDGGDELFGGYYRHVEMQKILRVLNLMPMAVRRAVQALLSSYGSRILGFLRPDQPQFETRILKLAAMMGHTNLLDLYEFITGQAEQNAITSGPRTLSGYPFRTSSNWPTKLLVPEWMMFADTVHYLPNNVLTKVDRATMAVSLEARAPLLDMNVFNHAWALPMSDKIKGRCGKQILRDVLARHLPRDLFKREKQGFAVPIGDWVRGPLKAHAEQYLTSNVLSEKLGIDPDAVQAVWTGHLSGKKPAPQTIWRLLVLAQWAAKYLR